MLLTLLHTLPALIGRHRGKRLLPHGYYDSYSGEPASYAVNAVPSFVCPGEK